MRFAVISVVVALLLPGLPFHGGHGDPAPPLKLFGGDAKPLMEGGSVLIVEAYYHALRMDEHAVIANVGVTPVDLAGWSLSDGEGVLTFPAGATAAPGARIVVAQNSTAYFENTLRIAAFRYGNGDATPMRESGSFVLNNAGDELILRDASDAVVDVLAYGVSPYSGEGWVGPRAGPLGPGSVARRDRGSQWRDTNTSVDWDRERVWSLGQSEFRPMAFDFEGTVTAAVTPDGALATLAGLLARATSSIDVSLYTFSNAALRDAVLGAAGRGARVRVLLEGAPVGGIQADEWSVLRASADAAEFHFMVDNSSLDIQERYAFQHAKYAIIDRSAVVVSTENWGASAFPRDNVTGSRGWLLVVNHPALAAHFAQVFEEDFDERRRDILTMAEMSFSPVPTRPVLRLPRPPRFAPRTVDGTFRVTPVIGPDTTLEESTILGAIRDATESIHVEMFYAHTAWGPFPNLYLHELLGAARRGVRVRLLLDSSWFNADENDPIDNDDTVLYLNTIAANEGLDLHAKLVDLEVHGFTQLHAKGFVIDRRTVLVSSVNWNRNSPTANREAGLLIENEDLAGFFEDVFAWDWRDDVTPPNADAGADQTPLEGAQVSFSGAGSSDDVAITNYSWDLDGDGAFDAWGPEVSRVYREPGVFTVRLRVSDSWNNSAEDTSVVSVRGRSPLAATPGVAFLAMGCIAVLVITTFLLLGRRRKGLSKPPWMERRGRDPEAPDEGHRRPTHADRTGSGCESPHT